MKNYFEREYYLRTADFDPGMNLLPTAILDLFQDVAGCHSIEMGCGLFDLIKINQAWVLVNAKYTILKKVKMFSKVRVKTWPLAPRGVRYQREYVIYDEDGERAVIGSQTWTVIDIVNRKILLASNVYDGLNGIYLEEKSYAERLPRIPQTPTDNAVQSDIKIVASDLDINAHVNNIRYAKFVYDVANLKEGEYIKELQIDYHKEIKFGQTVSLNLGREDRAIHAVGKVGDTVNFTALATVENPA